MSQATETAAIRRSVTVDRPIDHAFRVFTEGIGAWWPLREYSGGLEKAETVTMEGGEGGRIVERIAGGEEAVWGEILAWEPPQRILFTWHPGRDADADSTEIEVTFAEEGRGTRVELEHRRWERLGARGPEIRAQYEQGWPGVLEQYAKAAAR